MSLHLHLEPIGGLAGDMFAAALLDCLPHLWEPLQEDLARAGLLEEVTVAHEEQRVNGFAARAFTVRPRHERPNPTRHYGAIKAWLGSSALDPAVLTVALAIFDRLAEAEGRVHGCPPDEVHFHELADWDSLADIVAAASLIQRSGIASWSCGSLPMGRGRVGSAHGPIPLPAPAVTHLLEGFQLHDDGLPGERVTPTGAAILRHLMAGNETPRPPGRLQGKGAGCGTRRFPGLANLLHALVIETVEGAAPDRDRIAVIAFEVDDMTPEALATGLDRLRLAEGVRDVGYQLRHGKKGRSQFAVQVLASPERAETVAALCFLETSTLGLRLEVATRLILKRRHETVEIGSDSLPLKRALRPDGSETAKVEADALAGQKSHHRREALAAEASRRALPGERDD